MSTLESRYLQVQQRIHSLEQYYGRAPGSVKLLSVSKGQTVDSIRQTHHVGQQDFGENYLQEALKKIQLLADLPLCWHFIGQIQSNKSRDIACQFDWVHSVDRVETARKLSQHRPQDRPPLNICLQINLENETTKAGFNPTEITNAIAEIARLPRLALKGLMAIPQAHETLLQQRQPLHQLQQLLKHLNQTKSLQLDVLSMGMSHDLEAAIAEGATWVRIGTAIFGPRVKSNA